MTAKDISVLQELFRQLNSFSGRVSPAKKLVRLMDRDTDWLRQPSCIEIKQDMGLGGIAHKYAVPTESLRNRDLQAFASRAEGEVMGKRSPACLLSTLVDLRLELPSFYA